MKRLLSTALLLLAGGWARGQEKPRGVAFANGSPDVPLSVMSDDWLVRHGYAPQSRLNGAPSDSDGFGDSHAVFSLSDALAPHLITFGGKGRGASRGPSGYNANRHAPAVADHRVRQLRKK